MKSKNLNLETSNPHYNCSLSFYIEITSSFHIAYLYQPKTSSSLNLQWMRCSIHEQSILYRKSLKKELSNFAPPHFPILSAIFQCLNRKRWKSHSKKKTNTGKRRKEEKGREGLRDGGIKRREKEKEKLVWSLWWSLFMTHSFMLSPPGVNLLSALCSK